jgi:hypothetical protein
MSVTGTVCVVAFSAVNMIVAEYTPTPSAVGLTETLSPPGTNSLEAPNLSQLLSLGTIAVKLSPTGDPEKERDWAAGIAPPNENVKLSELGLTVIAWAATTCRVTGKIWVPASVTIVMLPE